MVSPDLILLGGLTNGSDIGLILYALDKLLE